VIKPEMCAFGYVKGWTVIFDTRIVRRYTIKALVIIEKSPSVSILTGKLIILRIGFKMRNIRASTTAPISIVVKPPSIVKPGTICGMKYRASK